MAAGRGGSLLSSSVADLPALPQGFTARPLTADDVAPVAALLAAAEQIDDTGEYPDAEDLAEWWTGWDLDPGRDGVAVTDRSDLIVGFATAMAPRTFRDPYTVYLEGRVRPEERDKGIGRALLEWQLVRGAEIRVERHPEAPAQLTVPVPAAMTSLETLVKSADFEAERWYRQMQRPLSDLPEVRPVPGIDLVPFSWDRDDEVRRAHNAAFTEHHGSAERDPASWQAMFTGTRSFRPELSVLGIEDGAVVGYVLAYVYEADSAATGVQETHLGQIGVLPGGRGRGLASALIAAALRVGAEHGCERSGLEVDSDNVTGALRLYEKLGFVITRTRVSWSRSLPPAPGG
jgi:mycothiol synthase